MILASVARQEQLVHKNVQVLELGVNSSVLDTFPFAEGIFVHQR